VRGWRVEEGVGGGWAGGGREGGAGGKGAEGRRRAAAEVAGFNTFSLNWPIVHGFVCPSECPHRKPLGLLEQH